MKHIAHPKIGQFRNAIDTVIRQATFTGYDDNEEAVYDSTIKLPIIEATGTVKLHGTLASVSYNPKDGIWYGSKNNIIDVENDNSGFAAFAELRKDVFINLITQVVEKHNIKEDKTVSIFGEFVGKGIQKGVAVNKLEKALFIFGLKVSDETDKDFTSYWLDPRGIRSKEDRIFNIYDYPTYKVSIDFNHPQTAQKQFEKIVGEIEANCPVGRAFDVEGTGEGAVWTFEYEGSIHRFKTKGEKHSVSRTKKVVPIVVENIESINKFIDYAVTPNRFAQALEITFGNAPLDIKMLGKVLQWMVKDILDEEMDVLVKNEIDPKEIKKYISDAAKKMFFKKYNTF